MKVESFPAPQSMRRIDSALPIALLRARISTSHRFKPFTDEIGLSQPQWRVIRALAGGNPLDARALAKLCVLMPPSVSRIVKELEKRELVAMHPSNDRRHKLWKITPSGLQLFHNCAVKAETVYQKIEAAFGKEELNTLVIQLNRLSEICGNLPDDIASMQFDEG